MKSKGIHHIDVVAEIAELAASLRQPIGTTRTRLGNADPSFSQRMARLSRAAARGKLDP